MLFSVGRLNAAMMTTAGLYFIGCLLAYGPSFKLAERMHVSFYAKLALACRWAGGHGFPLWIAMDLESCKSSHTRLRCLSCEIYCSLIIIIIICE